MNDLKMRLNRGTSKVAMFHIGRSGSTVVGDLLHQNKNIYWDGELFEPDVHRSFKHFSSLFPGKTKTFIRLHALKANLLRRAANYYGFETKFFHLRNQDILLPQYVSGLKQIGLSHVIILKRNNYLRKVISSLIAQQRNQYHLSNQLTSSLTQINFDVQSVAVDGTVLPLLNHFRQWDHDFMLLDQAVETLPTLRLTYEDDVFSDPQIAYGKICVFLNIDLEQSHVKFSKTNPFAVQDTLANFDQIAKALQDTGYEWMLYQ
jgi:hypothetical protein